MANSYTRYRNKRIKEEMAKQRADKMIDEMRESFVNMSEEELDELERNSIDAAFLEPDQKEYLFELYRKEKEQGN